ncbi:MAG: DUF993 family protein [Quadrisphaera sp.]
MSAAPTAVLLAPDGTTRSIALREAPAFTRPTSPITVRAAYAAAHVVPRVAAENTPGSPADIDWDATLAFRHHLFGWGLGVADAMDTAQRGMGLDPAAVRELVTRSAAAAREAGGSVVVGVSTDHLEEAAPSLDAITDAYCEQLAHAEDAGAGVVLMASRHLARVAEGPADYERVYSRVIARAGAPVLLHWLGTAFDPALAGYWGSDDVPSASKTVVRIIEDAAGLPGAVRGVKVSLLDADAEVALRQLVPAPARVFTGDDFHYVDLIAGDASADGETGEHSDALLGAFAAVGPNASAALQALQGGGAEGLAEYRRILEPTEALSRQVFAAPTFYYKTGVAFLSWLNGHQASPAMVGGLHSARSLPHLSELVRLSDAAGALEQPELAAQRWAALLAVHGVAS